MKFYPANIRTDFEIHPNGSGVTHQQHSLLDFRRSLDVRYRSMAASTSPFAAIAVLNAPFFHARP